MNYAKPFTTLFILFGLFTITIGCSAVNETLPVTPIVSPIQSLTATASALKAVTPERSETALPTATRLAETATPLLINTSTPTPAPSPTEAIALPQEQLLFLWDAKPLPQKDDPSSGDPIQDLYLGTFTGAPAIFNYKPILTDLIGWPTLVLSPNNLNLLLSLLEDSNLDGYVSQESNNQQFDFYNLFTYELPTGQLNRLTDNNFNAFFPQWLPNRQAALYQASQHSIVIIDTVNGTSLASFDLDMIDGISLSPDGKVLLANFYNELVLLNASTGEKLFITNEIYGPTAVWSWSPDSKWVALLDHRRQLYLINAETLTIQRWETAVSVHETQWLPAENILTIIQETNGAFSIAYLNPETLDAQPLFNGNGTIRYLLWSPDSSQLAFSEEQDGLFNLHLYNRTEHVTKSLWQIGDIDALFPLEWSQNQEWLLLQTWDDTESRANVYIASSQQAVVYPIFETTGTFAPYAWHWVSMNQSPP
ncbi:MAG: PD40 domain-containing protein [Anaerolineales bacterium]|nr:PD40 domain-containing protein [Anaerolineales bacterium]